MGCNSSALTGAGTLFRAPPSHTLAHRVFLLQSAPFPFQAQFQSPDPPWDGYIPREGAGPGEGCSVVSPLGRDRSPQGGGRRRGSKELSSSCSFSRKSPEMPEPRGDPPPQQTLLIHSCRHPPTGTCSSYNVRACVHTHCVHTNTPCMHTHAHQLQCSHNQRSQTTVWGRALTAPPPHQEGKQRSQGMGQQVHSCE